MAIEIVQVPSGADRQGMTPADIAAHEAASYVRRAPLPRPAVEALAKLELAFIPMPLDVVWAVTRYEVASARYDELIARPASSLSGAEFKSFGEAQQTIADAFGVLAEYGRLDLIEVAS